MAGPTIAGEQVVWGTNSDTTYGMIQNMTKGKGGSQKEYKDFRGDTKTLVTYDKHDTVQISTLVVGSAPTLPEKGDVVSIGGVSNVYVTDASENWSNEDASSVTISGRTYPAISTSSGGNT